MADTDPVQEGLIHAFLTPLNTVQELRNWVFVYLGIDLPVGHVDPDSNSSPSEWLFEAYTTYRFNRGNEVHGYVVLSSRASYKTLTESIFSTLVMLHFRARIAHMAAIEPQAHVAIGYITSFINKISTYIKAHGMTVDSQSKRMVTITDKDGAKAEVKVIILTMQGANSYHGNITQIDETDVVRSMAAYNEANAIKDVMNGQYPLTIVTSTRKFAGGLMNKEIEEAPAKQRKVLRWNYIDITEKCSNTRAGVGSKKATVYVYTDLPLKTIAEPDFMALPEKEKSSFEAVKTWSSGCAKCKLLPVCRGRLNLRPDNESGGLYKPIDFTIGQFMDFSPDMAVAQLMNWRPTTEGLVYGRFLSSSTDGNLITMDDAYEILTGDKIKGVSLFTIIDKMVRMGIPFHAGGDWGFRHNYVVIIGALLPNGDWWLVDSRAIAGLEFEEMIAVAEGLRDYYARPRRWFMDPAQPMFLKAFKRRGMPCKTFKKDIMGGVEAVRGQIVNAQGRRRMKILVHEGTDHLVRAVRGHSFKLDAQGRVTTEVSDDTWADECLAPDTLINTIGGFKRICEISVGEMVMTHEGRFRMVLATSRKDFDGEICRMVIDNKPDTLITPNHPVFISQGGDFSFEPVKTIDLISTPLTVYPISRAEGNVYTPIKSITYESYSGSVYNLRVEEDNSYVANFSVVHNCDSLRYMAQNLFAAKGKVVAASMPGMEAAPLAYNESLSPNAGQNYQTWLTEKIQELTSGSLSKGGSEGAGIIWDFTGSQDEEI